MKRSILSLLVALSILTLLTACSSKKVYIKTSCANIATIDRVPDINITTNASGGLDPENSFKLVMHDKALRASETYYRSETIRLRSLNAKRD